MEDSEMIDKICRAQALASNGDGDSACALYADLWTETTRAENQYQACVVAHFMAHAHSDPGAQLDWHLRSLHAADAVGDERVLAFYPSLYANLGDVYLRLGNLALAQEFITRARQTDYILLDDGYGRMIRSLIARLAKAVGLENAPG